MNSLRATVLAGKVVKNLGDHRSRLLFGNAMDDSSRVRVQGTKDVALDVLSRRQHHQLPAGFELGRSDLRIEMDIHFVLIEDLVLRRRTGNQFLHVLGTLRRPRTGVFKPGRGRPRRHPHRRNSW